MQKVSATYERLRGSENKWYEQKLIIDGVGEFGESELTTPMESNSEMLRGGPSIGMAVAADLQVSLFMPSAEIPSMACLRPYVRLCGYAPTSPGVTITDGDIAVEGATYENGDISFPFGTYSGGDISFPESGTEYLESEWLPQGVFYIDTREVTANNDGLPVLTIHGYDAMLKTEQDYSGAVAGDDLDTAYVQEIARQIGVEVDDRTWEIMGGGTMIPFPVGYSMREILGYIAAPYIGSFIMSDEGKLRLVSLLELPTETNLLIDNSGDVITFGKYGTSTETQTGAVVAFENGNGTAFLALSVDIQWNQDLSHGDPSPANICPITGFDSEIVRVSASEGGSANVYEISFSSVGTVYKGTLDVNSGVLTLTWKGVDGGDLVWSRSLSGYRDFASANVDNIDDDRDSITVICSMYPAYSYNDSPNYGISVWPSTVSNGRGCFFVRDRDAGGTMTAEQFRAHVTGQTFLWKLATPETYQLTAQQVQTLVGSTFVKSNTGDTTATYEIETEAVGILI